MRKFFLLICVWLCAIMGNAQNSDWDDVVVVNTDNLNMRRLPSASSEPLGYISMGLPEEDSCGFDPQLMWRPASVKKGKFVNLQLFTGSVFPLVKREGEWLQISYSDFRPWIMAKYVSVEKIKPLYPGITFSGDNEYCNHILMILPDGRALYYLEPDPEQDGCLYFGRLNNGKVVLDTCVDGNFYEDESVNGINPILDNGWLTVYWGKSLSNPRFDFLSLYLSRLTPEMYDDLLRYARPLPSPKVVYMTPSGSLELIQ